MRPGLRVRVVVCLQGHFRHAMAAKVECHQTELIGKSAFELPAPAQMVLRPSMYEENRRSIRLAPFTHMQPYAAATDHRMSLHRVPPLLKRSDASRLPWQRVW